MIAIEPFASTGKGYIKELGKSEVFMMVAAPRNAKGLDREVLKAFESWRGLPIARRYFTHLDSEAVEHAIGKLAKQGSLMRFPPLVEDEGVMVAQANVTVVPGQVSEVQLAPLWREGGRAVTFESQSDKGLAAWISTTSGPWVCFVAFCAPCARGT